jgi:signal transduction histidine kinase
MISRLLRSAAALGISLFLLSGAFAAEGNGSPEEAKAMAEIAAARLRSDGAEKAFAAFNAAEAPFKDRDLYVVALTADGTDVAHGGNKALVGKKLLEMRDPGGKWFVKDILAVQTAGWVEYSFQDPVSKAIKPKRSYVIHEGDYWVLVGAYAK